MKKMSKLLAMLTVGSLLLAGCSTKTTEETVTEKLPTTISVTHNLGTTEIPVNPKKIAVFDAGILDSIGELGTDAEIGFPVSSLPKYLSQFSDATSIGSLKEPDLEALYEFQPDLIIISGRVESYYEELSKIAPTWYAASDYSDAVEHFKRTTTTLGTILGKEDVAAEKISALETKIQGLVDVTSAQDKKALIVLTNDGTISAYGLGSRFGFVHDDLKVPIADATLETSTHGQEIGYEYIAQLNPDLIFVVDRTQVVAGTVDSVQTLDNPLVNGTTAAQNNDIYLLTPEYWYISGMGITSLGLMIDEVAAAFN